MTTEATRFYIEVLTTRQRLLKAKMAEVGRWHETFSTLQRELETVEDELEGIADDHDHP